MRALLAVVAGFLAWPLVFNGGYAVLAALRPEELGIFEEVGTRAGPLLLGLLLVLSVVASAAAGWLAGRILRGAGSLRPVQVLAAVLLAVGLVAQSANWEVFPLWYHVPFLVLIVPVTLAAGRRALAGPAASAA